MNSQRWLSWYMELLDHWHKFYVHALNLERYSILVIILKTNWLYSFLPFHYLFFSEWKRQEVFVLKWAINSCKCWFYVGFARDFESETKWQNMAVRPIFPSCLFSFLFKNNPIFFWFGHTCLSANLHGLRRNICYTLNLVGNKTKWNTSANPMWINPACEKGETEYYSSSASGGQSKLNLEMRQGSVSGVKIAVFQDL